MSKAAYRTIYILIAIMAINIPATAFAKAKPLPGIMMMFDEFNDLEEKFRAEEWDEAKHSINKIQSSYKELVSQLKTTVDSKTIQKFGFFAGNLKKRIARKDENSIEKPYIALQGLFLDIMDYYDYESPAVLIIIDRYIGEATEGLEKKDFRETAGEMEEIGDFKSRAEKAFKEKGASPDFINDFFEKIENVGKLADAQKSAEAKALLIEVKTMIGTYVKTNSTS